MAWDVNKGNFLWTDSTTVASDLPFASGRMKVVAIEVLEGNSTDAVILHRQGSEFLDVPGAATGAGKINRFTYGDGVWMEDLIVQSNTGTAKVVVQYC